MLLTEHFEFPPITFVDDVINSVNEIMYKCTAALEKYLISKRDKLQVSLRDDSIILNNDNDNDNTEESNLDEIEVGTAKLETLLESSVDKNFDLFELYTLRNIFNIPSDLVEEGWIKLDHYKHVRMINNPKKKLKEIEQNIQDMEQEIKFQLFLKQKLTAALVKAKKILRMLKLYSAQLKFLQSSPTTIRDSVLMRSTIEALRSLSPLDESIFFLKNEAKSLYKMIQILETKFNESVKDSEILPNERDTYVDTKAYKLLKLYYDDQKEHDLISIKLSKIEKTDRDASKIRKVNEVLNIESIDRNEE